MTVDVIAIDGPVSSLVLEPRAADAPLWRWWGTRAWAPGATLADVRPPASFALDDDQPLSLVPTFGLGWFGPAALLAHRGGTSFAQSWTAVSVDRDGDTVIVRLDDAVAGIVFEQRLTRVDATDAVVMAARVVNTRTTPLDVQWCAAATLPLPADSARLLGFTGRHTHEFVPADEPMPSHAWLRENRRGLTGHAGPPGLFVLGPDAGRHHGRVNAAQLAWSGNHRLEVVRLDDGRFVLQLGEWLAPGEVRLSPGEAYDSPEVIAVATDAGLNGAMQAFHAAVRARAPWPAAGMRPRPVHLNSWEGVYFDHDEPRMTALADRAADLGVERFVLDDGWFRGRSGEAAGLGDWTADPVKYPAGLRPLADHVRARGMEFGLWVEPEMISPDSDLYRAHPDWVLALAGRNRPTARRQLVLDLGRAAVRDHLFAVLAALIAGLDLAYLKWDHNRALAPAAGADGRPAYRTQVLGAYALIHRLRAAFPALEIEACAGGGGRSDAGMAARSHRFWTSDNIDARSRVDIQRGFLLFLPPEMMGSHVGASPAHATGRAQAMGFRAGVALPGHLGVELDPAALAAADAADLAAWIGRYQAWRDRLHHGRVWLGEAPDGIVWQAHGEVGDVLLVVTRVAPSALDRPLPVVVPFLAGAGLQRVRLLALSHGAPPRQAPGFTALAGGGVTWDGDWLAAAGLPLPALRGEGVAVFAVRAA